MNSGRGRKSSSRQMDSVDQRNMAASLKMTVVPMQSNQAQLSKVERACNQPLRVFSGVEALLPGVSAFKAQRGFNFGNFLPDAAQLAEAHEL